MPPKVITPSIGQNSFNCPVCGALADQEWFEAYASRIGHRETPRIIDSDALDQIKDNIKKSPDYESEKFFIQHFERESIGEVFLSSAEKDCRDKIINIYLSKCYSCSEITVWRRESILYPPHRYEIEPNEDMPENVRADFNEARQILDLSPRGAAALLRLCIQKILIYLEVPGKTIDSQIATLVEDGLSTKIRDALDVVRVIGNESVHPGRMDLRDDRATASKLFELVNMIAHDRITHPKELNELFQTLPESKRAAIEKRDSKKKKNGNLGDVSDKPSD